MKTAALLLAAFWIGATLVPVLRSPAWWVRVFDFPRLQIAAGSVLTLGLLTATTFSAAEQSLLDGAVGAALAGCALYQAVRMWPYTPLAPKESVTLAKPVEARHSLRLVVSNVLMGNREKERWLTTVRAVDPDVIATLESNQWWQDTVFADLRAAYPHAVEVPQEDTYGMHLYSRLPLEDVAVRRRVDDIVPSIEATVVLPSGSRVTAYVLHPMPPRPEFNQHTDRRDAELILVAREVAARREADPARPIIVAGDLNDVAWSRTTLLFQRLSGLLDPRKGRGPYSTFHADYWPLRWPLDHVFHSDDLRLLHLERLGHVGSDHFPIHVAFVLDPAAAPYQNAPEAEADDREDAAAVLDEAAKRAAERDPEEEPAPEER